MSNYTFEIKTSSDLLRKLEKDFVEFGAHHMSSSKALNCAMSAWHLTDWVHHERAKDKSGPARSTFQKRIAATHNFLALMHDVANGGKHLGLSNPKTKVQSSYAVPGSHDLSHGYADHDVARLVLNDGQTEWIFLVELEKAVNFWRVNLCVLNVD
ncbi:MAG: hypothetical protein ABI432_19330 [Flavobacteriales bacterium]